MLKVSDILGKPLICLAEAEIIGTVSNVFFDYGFKKAVRFSIFNDDNEDDSSLKYINTKDIYQYGEDGIIIKTKASITNFWNTSDSVVSPINNITYNQSGKLLGKITDITIKDNKVVSLDLNELKIKSQHILSFSDKIIIINDTGKPIKLPKLNIPEIKEGQTVSITVSENKEPKSIELPNKIPQTNTMVTRSPAEINTPQAYAFLIGKYADADVFDEAGGVIVRSDQIIDEKIIAIAKEKGKLIQLALHSVSK